MNKTSTKLVLSIAGFLVSNLWLIAKGVTKGAADFFIYPITVIRGSCLLYPPAHCKDVSIDLLVRF